MSRAPVNRGVVLDADVRILPSSQGGGQLVLVGGAPVRLVRLSAAASAVLGSRDWSSLTGQALAERLIDTGLAHPRPDRHGPDVPGAAQVTVVVPVRDRPDGVRRLLAALDPQLRVVVVDDGSAVPLPEATVRHQRPLGPAAARNAGLAHVTTPIVAFLDSDCVPELGWLDALLPHLADARVALVAPRIVAAHGGRARSALLSYEQARSPLDLGPREAAVTAGGRVSYVPAAAMLARRAALGPGFVPHLRFGEDVDLVWRLVDAGWRVRYEPAARVGHAGRGSLREWLRQRYGYGLSAAPLQRAHPGQVPPLRMTAPTAATWALALTLCPLGLIGAAGVATVATLRLARRLPVQHPTRLAGRLVLTGTAAGGRQLLTALLRPWWPVALPALLPSRRGRLLLAAALLGRPLADRTSSAHRSDLPLDPLRWTLLQLLDDLSYSTGVWVGCCRERHVGALLPRGPGHAGPGDAGQGKPGQVGDGHEFKGRNT